MEDILFTIGMIILLGGISAHDIRSRTIPDRCNGCLLIWVLTGQMLDSADRCAEGFEHGTQHSLSAGMRFVDLQEGIMAAAGMLLIILAADLLYLHLRGLPVIGGGDLKLLCIAALALGFSGVLIGLTIAILLATVWIGTGFAIGSVSDRGIYGLHSRIPLAPFLSAGLALSFIVY